ncbi:MAG: polysaccharide biosynthesis C-terminal domain-containing protein [Parasporobacterium sp.]|nr:polysaccharide biosynthesis C-terminal domain-containing protein [Parasporobacterium sp.]
MDSSALATENIRKLIRRFAVPCCISMVVAALYNIVDQVYIGWSNAGAYGNAATNIVYPFTVIALGLALLAGDGAAASFSLFLGAGEKKKASRCVGNGLLMLILFSVLLLAAGLILKDPILRLFGATPAEELCYQYANDYYFWICLGIPFYIIGQGMNASIRADGSPRFAMAATLAGSIANIILDPVFIFALDMEVEGAAIATVIGQLVTFVMTVIYLTRSRSFKVSRESIRPEGVIIRKELGLGLASLIIQLSIVAIMTVANNLVGRYGYETLSSSGEPFGIVTPLAVIGICMKVFGIVISVVIGVSLGGQPIIGYNMGAGNLARVRETCLTIVVLDLIIGLIAMALFELCPYQIVSIFGTNNGPVYQEYAVLCMRIFLGGIACTCLVKSISILLQSMGNSFKSTLLALSRDVIFFIPAIILLASLTGSVVGMLWSAVIADILAAVTGILLLFSEFRKLQKSHGREEDL